MLKSKIKTPWKYALLLVLCVALNYGGKALAMHFGFPIWLDMAGTLVATYYLGLVGGCVCALLGNALYAFIDPTSLIYSVSGILCAAVFFYCSRQGRLKSFPAKVRISFWIALTAIVSSTPINILFYNCKTGNRFGDALFDMLTWYGWSKIPASIPAEAVVDIPDKQACMVIACVLIWIIDRFLPSFIDDNDEKKNDAAKGGVVKKGGAAALLLLLSVLSVTGAILPCLKAEASESSWEYSSRIYNNRNGLMSSDANVIEETPDGFIWIGGYAGLTKFDGSNFEFITENGIANVTDMVCDSSGRLWIGTNDSGVVRYEDGEFTFFRKEDGLSANSIRCLMEGEDGTMYVGTSGNISAISADGTVSTLNDEVTHAYSMTIYEGMIVCAGSDGNIYVLKDGQLISTSADIDFGENEPPRFSYAASTKMGLLAGTNAKEIYTLDITDEKLVIKNVREIPVQGIKYIGEDHNHNVWACGDDGFGCFEGITFRRWDIGGFTSSIEGIHEDFQGNIWVASSRAGVLCLSPSPFSNTFLRAGFENRVCNAVIPYRGGMCIGTDTGILFADADGMPYTNEFGEMLGEGRIRCLMEDSRGGLWACTYSESALSYMSEGGDIKCYTTADSPFVTSDKPRCILELSNGEIAVGTADGLYFIENGKPVASIKSEDGLTNSQILTLMEGNDGKLYAGSDGGGLFVIEDHKITGSYTTDDGLSSDVILRTTACDDGILVVTSNSLCHISEKEVIILNRFPYYNNFDILIEDGMAYVLSSAGLFSVALVDLCHNTPQTCTLYDSKYGFDSAITANSWNYIGDDGVIYMCCNDGVFGFTPVESTDTDYRFGFETVSFDGTPLSEIPDTISIPSDVTSVDITASVKNYSLADVKVRFFVEELDAARPMVSYHDIMPVRILNPDSGTYTVKLQVFASDGTQLLEEKVVTLTKETQLWEKTGYIAYLIGLLIDIIICIMLVIFGAVAEARQKAQLVSFNATLEQRVEEQTHEISVQNEKINLLLSETVIALARAVDAKDRYTSGHSIRVAKYSRMIAEKLGKSKEERDEIYRAGILHDVGKISVPLEIINKPGKLTDEEYAVIKQHPKSGYDILKEIKSAPNLCMGAWYHHERYDGRGYPNGLAGEDIPEIGRIIGVADAYDAMASNRSYRKALPQDVVRSEIEKGRGTQFDPVMADIMLDIIADDPEYKLREPDDSRNVDEAAMS